MEPARVALRLLAVGLLMLGPLPATAGSGNSPEPVEDPLGLLLPLPGCGIAGRVVTAPRTLRVRLAAGQRRQRPPARRAGKPALPPADLGALARQALYGCAVAAPDAAGVATGARPLRLT